MVTRVLENGGHIMGKATCEVGHPAIYISLSDTQNFSHGATSSSSAYGPVENPYAVGFSTGGSSSGCGGLIGSGEIDMGVGGDQGGSIRIVCLKGVCSESAMSLTLSLRRAAVSLVSSRHSVSYPILVS